MPKLFIAAVFTCRAGLIWGSLANHQTTVTLF